MQYKVYSIRDQKVQIFNQPFMAHTHGEAERNFQRLVKDDKSMLNQFPEDYDLYYLGTYDDHTGIHSSLDTPQHIQKAVTFKEQ